jgi:hypothetical protein
VVIHLTNPSTVLTVTIVRAGHYTSNNFKFSIHFQDDLWAIKNPIVTGRVNTLFINKSSNFDGTNYREADS